MTFHGSTGRFKVVGTVDQAGADELIKTSLDAGIKFFDTADVYSEGESEKMLEQSLKNLSTARKDVVLATKVLAQVGMGRNDVAPPADISWMLSMRACAVSRPTTSTSIRFMVLIHHAVGGTPARSRRSRYPRQGTLHRLFQLAGLEDRESAGHFRAQEPRPARHPAGLPSRVGTSNANWFPSWKPKRSASWCGVRWPEACSRENSAARTSDRAP